MCANIKTSIILKKKLVFNSKYLLVVFNMQVKSLKLINQKRIYY